MLAENVFPPIPSEVILPLAGYTAAQGRGSLWVVAIAGTLGSAAGAVLRSEEHTSELQSLMRISYAVFCLKKKKYEEKYINKCRKQQNTRCNIVYDQLTMSKKRHNNTRTPHIKQ